jgi:hypothetical protein
MLKKHTLLGQITQMISRYDFEKAVTSNKGRHFTLSFDYWSHFMAMMFGQLSDQHSLRDLVLNLSSQSHRFYHLGMSRICRSTFSDANNNRPYQIYENLFYHLLDKYGPSFKDGQPKLKGKLYTIDATVVGLCLSLFGWAKFRTTKAGIKLHVRLDHDRNIPEYAVITNASVHESQVRKMFDLPSGSLIVFDRGYTDYHLYSLLNERGILFVTRLKDNADYRVIKRRKATKRPGITSDQIIEFRGFYSKGKCPIKLRRIRYIDRETGQVYVYLTNDLRHSASTIADIYKQRWQIELFFKALKQNLVIKTFWGTSENAVYSQIWVALILYFLLSVLKAQANIETSVGKMIQRIRSFVFETTELMRFLKNKIPVLLKPAPPNQITLNLKSGQ